MRSHAGFVLAGLLASTSLGRTQDWRQPPIHTGTPDVEALGWASTLEEALVRAKREKKLVLATVVAVSDDRWVGGTAGAQAHGTGKKAPFGGDEVAAARDEGLRKERVMM